ncbi:MAG: 4-hydroxyproline epimerase [Sphingomonadales bacterium]
MKHTFSCIDAHTCGNPVRVIKEGGPSLQGQTMSQRRQHFLKEYDWIRRGLMFEPRGHDMMSGSIVYPPIDKEHDASLLFIETSGCLPMCGHGTIGTVTIAIEEGIIIPKRPGQLLLETPAGSISVQYQSSLTNGKLKVEAVRLTNVASFLYSENLSVNCPDVGELVVDVSYGGNFYAIVDVQPNFKGIEHYRADQLVAWSRGLRTEINRLYSFVHPGDPTIHGCSHVLWAGAVLNGGSTARNAVFYGDKAIDRSPCGTGTSARMAQWYAKGKLAKGQEFIHESIIGSCFTGRIEEEVTLGSYRAIRPSIEGWARLYGYNTIWIDPEDDPYAYGFQVI